MERLSIKQPGTAAAAGEKHLLPIGVFWLGPRRQQSAATWMTFFTHLLGTALLLAKNLNLWKQFFPKQIYSSNDLLIPLFSLCLYTNSNESRPTGMSGTIPHFPVLLVSSNLYGRGMNALHETPSLRRFHTVPAR